MFTFTHSGKEKKLNFNIKKFSNFKNKIIYLINDEEPESIIYAQNKTEAPDQMRPNAMKRIANQREFLLNGLQEANDNDLILYSDNDEIPNPQTLNENLLKKKFQFLNKNYFIISSIYFMKNFFGMEREDVKKRFTKI